MSHEQVVLVNSYANVCDSIINYTLFMHNILVNFCQKLFFFGKKMLYFTLFILEKGYTKPIKKTKNTWKKL